LLVGHLLLATAFSLLTPLGEAPDEADHWAYIVYLANERQMPVGPGMTQSKHPPLYHATAAIIASLSDPRTDMLRANPDVELAPRPGWSPNFFIHTAQSFWPWDKAVWSFHLVRLWSVCLSTLTVVVTYRLALTAFPRQPALALTATGILAFIPEFSFIGGAVNNDNAAALFGALGLWAGLRFWRQNRAWRSTWWAPLALGGGLLSKTSTVGLWPAVGLGIVMGAALATDTPLQGAGAWRRAVRQQWRQWLTAGVLVFGSALALALPWMLRNWQLYGDPLGLALAIQTIDVRSTPWQWHDSVWLVRGWFLSFWGKFGGAGHIPMATGIYAGLAVLTGLSLIGLAGNLLPARRRFALAPLLILATAAIGVAAVMGQYSLLALGTDQGRLLYPAVAALVLLWTAGLLWLAPARYWAPVGTLLVTMTLMLGLYGLLGVVRPAFAPPSPPSAAEIGAAKTGTPLQFGPLALIGWRLDDEVTLYWQATDAPAEDYRVVLRLVAEDGTLMREWRRSPGAGRWSTDRWPAGALVADIYRIAWPDGESAKRYLIEVGVQPFAGDLMAPADSEAGQIYAPLGALVR